MTFHSKYAGIIIGTGMVIALTGTLSGCSGSSTTSNKAASTSSSSSSLASSSSSPSSSPSSGDSGASQSLTTQCSDLSSGLEEASNSLSSSMETFSSALSSSDPTALDKAQSTVDQLSSVFDAAAAKVTNPQLKPAVDKLGNDFEQLATLTKAIVKAKDTNNLSGLTQSAGQIQSLVTSMQSDADAISKMCGF